MLKKSVHKHSSMKLISEKAELKTVEETIDQLTTDLASQRKEKAKLEQKIEADQMFLNEHPLPADSDQGFSQAKAHFATLTEKGKIHCGKSKELSEMESRIAQQQRNLDTLEKKLGSFAMKRGLPMLP